MNLILYVIFGYGVPLLVIATALIWIWLAGKILGA